MFCLVYLQHHKDQLKVVIYGSKINVLEEAGAVSVHYLLTYDSTHIHTSLPNVYKKKTGRQFDDTL